MSSLARLAVGLIAIAALYSPVAARTLPDNQPPTRAPQRAATAPWGLPMERTEQNRSRPTPRDCNDARPRWTRAEIVCAIRRTFPRDPITATCIAWRESRLDPRAVGRLGERGIFQLHPVHRAWLGTRWAKMFDPVENARAARDLYRQAGWAPWSTANACT